MLCLFELMTYETSVWITVNLLLAIYAKICLVSLVLAIYKPTSHEVQANFFDFLVQNICVYNET
jgi:hypothetical protein